MLAIDDIFGSDVAKTLPTLPFHVLRCLLDVLPVTSEEGRDLRRAMADIKAVHFILACLAVFTHQNVDPSLVPGLQHELVIAAAKAQGGYQNKQGKSDDKSHVYWPKGTGFGTGSTAQSWDVELAMQKKKQEEENVTCLLNVLSSFIHPRVGRRSRGGDEENTEPEGSLPSEISDLLRNSCLFPAIAGYLRNDSGIRRIICVSCHASCKFYVPGLTLSYLVDSSGYGTPYSTLQSSPAVPSSTCVQSSAFTFTCPMGAQSGELRRATDLQPVVQNEGRR